ncbi:hypothetical protein LIER_06720 [Lithospermum erythrorhizon]|uniref:Uncharacterized protein n=1 Tax=Lithospermum erythrorhizon TaxID=34254 RepID=A0AAV3P5D0_LITER
MVLWNENTNTYLKLQEPYYFSPIYLFIFGENACLLQPSSLIGYPFGKKAYKIDDLITKSIITFRDVVFHGCCYPFHNTLLPSQSILPVIPDDFPISIFYPIAHATHNYDIAQSPDVPVPHPTSSFSSELDSPVLHASTSHSCIILYLLFMLILFFGLERFFVHALMS